MKKRLLLIVAVYFIFSISWIFFSDQFLLSIVSTPEILSQLQLIKGFVFIIITTLLLILSSLRVANSYIREKKKLQKQNEEIIERQNMLLKEMNHRIKNNIGILTNLIDLKKYIYADEETQKLLDDLRDKTLLISYIHEKIYTSVDVTEIEVSNYIKGIIETTNKFYSNNVSIKYNIDEHIMKPKHAINIALILQEIFTNSIKHAYKGIYDKQFFIDIKYNNGVFDILVGDNGNGYTPTKLHKSESFGMEMIKTIVFQYEGLLEFYNNNGMIVKIVLKEPI